MKKHIAVTALAALGLASAAQAQDGAGPGRGDPWGDATVSRADEVAKAGERFAAIDANKDGALSADEIAAQSGAPGEGRRGPGGGLRRADADGDGKVTKAEYVAAQLGRFDRQDANKDGQLTKAERDAARAEMRERMSGGPPRGEFGGFGGSGDE